MVVRGGGPVHLAFFVTSRCQLACRHCFYWQSLGTDSQRELTVDEIARIAPGIGRLLWLALTGGEPFIRGDLVEIVRILDASCAPQVLTIVTNGWDTGSIARQLPEILRASGSSLVQLNFSLDGPEDVHDALRCREGSFGRLMESYRVAQHLAQRHPRLGLGINTAFSSLVQHRMAPLEALVLHQLQPRHWDISLVRDKPKDQSVQAVDLDLFFLWKERLERRLLEASLPYHALPGAKLALARHLQQNDHLRAYLREPGYSIPCLAGTHSAVLYDDGSLALCEQRPERLGNLRDVGWDFGELWQSERAKALRQRIRDDRCHCDNGCNIAINTLFRPRSAAGLAPALFRVLRRGR